MADECKKASLRRSTIGAFTDHYMAGEAIDIGSGGDGLSKHAHLFPKITSVRDWDLEDGDANEMPGIASNTFDLVHSSHCFEHMKFPWKALHRWFEITKVNGYMVLVFPDFHTYEQPFDELTWVPQFNPDHKCGFTLRTGKPRNPLVKNLLQLLDTLPNAEVVRAEVLDWTLPTDRSKRRDYSSYDGEEPSIEIVIRKRNS